MLETKNGLVTAYTNVQVSVLRSLAEKLHVPAVQKVITPAYEYFLNGSHTYPRNTSGSRRR